jgi:hypothetical protein
MKLMLHRVAIALFLAAGSLVSFTGTAAKAQSSVFYCGTDEGIPTTMASTSQDEVPVIRWVSDHFANSGWTPQARCEEVSQRFQTYHQDGSLKFLTTGRMNGQPVVCTADRQGGGCIALLFTLKPTSNPGATLQQLIDVRFRASGALSETDDRVYIDINQILAPDAAPTETSSQGTSSSNAEPAW